MVILVVFVLVIFVFWRICPFLWSCQICRHKVVRKLFILLQNWYYLLLHKQKLRSLKQTFKISHGSLDSGWGIQPVELAGWFCLSLFHEFAVKISAKSTVIWRVDWEWKICFQVSGWLMHKPDKLIVVVGRSSLSHEPCHQASYLWPMAPGCFQNDLMSRKAEVTMSSRPNLGSHTWSFSQYPFGPACYVY